MKYDNFFKLIKENANSENSIPMEKYMKNKFPFLGIKTPLRRKKLCKEEFKKLKELGYINWDFIDTCYMEEMREFQYVAIDYLSLVEKYLVEEDIVRLETLITTKSWWDSVDGISHIIGYIVATYPFLKPTIIKWSLSDNIWLRRTAIIHQLLRKEKTDTKLLEEVIINNLGSKEFFINKGIGWALRDYSKTNPSWVAFFINNNKELLSNLSIKEGSKYI